jgi:flavodoxin
VGVIYASAYGNTTAMAQAISRGVAKAGVGVESLNCEMSDPEEVKELVRRCSGFVLGSPTLGGHMPTPIQEALGAILQEARDARTKPCGVFGSFGWSGEAIDMMHSALKASAPPTLFITTTHPLLRRVHHSAQRLALLRFYFSLTLFTLSYALLRSYSLIALLRSHALLRFLFGVSKRCLNGCLSKRCL